MFATAKNTSDTVRDAMAKDTMANEGGLPPQNIRESVNRIKNDSRDAAKALKDDVEDVARQAGKQVREMADAAGNSATDMTKAVSQKIRDNPVQSTLIALGVGIVAGILYRR